MGQQRTPAWLTGLVFAAGLLGANAAQAFDVVSVPWVPTAPGIPHDNYNGRATTLKAVGRGVTGQCRYYWEYGDGTTSAITQVARVSNNDFCDLQGTKTFANQPADRLFVARVHACDTGPGNVACDPDAGASAEYRVQIHATVTRQVRVNAAISDGLWYIHRNWVRFANANPALRTARTSFGDTNGATAMGCSAYFIQGHNLRIDEATDPYVTDAIQCINYLTASLRRINLGALQGGQQPDTNGNGFGLFISNSAYTDGMALTALGDAANGDFVARTGLANDVLGRPLRDIAQDYADFFYYGQGETNRNDGHGVTELMGGWWYNANQQPGEGSTNQWPVLGLSASKANYGITVPQWVKDRQDNFLDYIQYEGASADLNGGFGYNNATTETNLAKTAAGLAAMSFIGYTADSTQPDGNGAGHGPSAERAWSFIARKWHQNEGSYGNYHWGSMYAMFGVKKAAYAFTPHISCISNNTANLYLGTQACLAAGGQPWEDQYDDYFTEVGQCMSDLGLPTFTSGAILNCQGQGANGSWRDSSAAGNRGNFGTGGNFFATAITVIILSPSLFEIGPIAKGAAAPTTANPGDTITFDHSQSVHPAAPLNHIVVYRWDWDNGNGLWWDDANVTGALPAHYTGYVPQGCAGDCAGYVTDCSTDASCASERPQTVYNDVVNPGQEVDHHATLQVLDDHDPALSDIDDESVTIKVSRFNHAPVSVCDPTPPAAGQDNYAGTRGQVLMLDGRTSFDPDVGQPLECGNPADHIVRYDWDLDGDGTFETLDNPTPVFTVPANAPDGRTYVVQLRVTDDGTWASCFPGSQGGLTAVSSCSIGVVPNLPPIADGRPDGTTLECVSTTGDGLTSVTLDGTHSSDPDGDPITYAWSPAAGLDDATSATPTGRFPVGQTQLTLTVTDNHEASATNGVSFTLQDTQAPRLTCHDDIVECAGPDGTAANPSATAIDACQGDVAATTDAPLPALYPRGVTVETFSANDAYGNLGSCDAQVIVQDTTAPTIACPDDATRDADASCHGDFNLMAQATDACDGALNATADHELGAVFGLGSTPVTYSTSDADGNPASCATTVTVVDHSAPSLTCQAPVTVPTEPDRCDAAADVVTPTGHDNCDGDLPATGGVPARFPRGTTDLSFSVADHAGNAQSCATSVTVEDRQAPSIECPAPIEVPTGPTGCSAVVNNFAAAANDNCDLVSATQTAPAGNVYGLGTTDVTFQVADQSGNANTCSTSVTVVDTGDPVVDCPPLMVVNADPDTCGVHVDVAPPTTSDDCGGSLTVVSDAPAVFGLGTTEVHYTVTDAAGNHTSCTTAVQVVDVTAPSLTCPEPVTVDADPQTCRQTVDLEATATDACYDQLALDGNGSFGFGLGSATHSITVTDGSGNTSSCDAHVTVVDATPPVMTVRTGISLWPPNHKYQRISTSDCVAAIRDACDGQARSVGIGDVVVTGVSSDEVEDGIGNGDGDTLKDMIIVDSSHVDLRAEREGTGNGRVYSIQLRVADAAGNVTTGVCKVGVPHDQGGQPAAVEGPGPGYSIP